MRFTVILRGVGSAQITDRIAARKRKVGGFSIRKTYGPAPPQHGASLPPRSRGSMRRALSGKHRREAIDIIRSLVDRIVLKPLGEGKRPSTPVDLQGHLPRIKCDSPAAPGSSPKSQPRYSNQS